MPVNVVTKSKAKVDPMRQRSMQCPTAELVFTKVDRGHEENEHIVKSHSDRGSDFVAAQNPSEQNREQGFQWIKRSESKENSNGRAERDRMWRVRHRNERHVMVDEPTFLSLEEFWQTRFLVSLRGWFGICHV